MKEHQIKLMLIALTIIFFVAGTNAGAWTLEEAAAPYKGTTVHVAYMAGYPYNSIIEKIHPEFTKITGIKIEMDAVNYGEAIGKYMRELAAGSPSHDLYDTEAHAASQFAPFCEPLETFEKNPKLTDPEFNRDDIYPNLQFGMSYDNKLYAYSQLNTNAGIYYRKDLLQKYGIKEPTLDGPGEWGLDEYYEAAKKLTKDLDGDGKTDLYGTTLHGSRTGIGDEIYTWFWGAGGQLFDDKMKPYFGKGAKYHKEMVKALSTYQKLYTEGLVPPGSTDYELGEAMGVFNEGLVAMMWNWDLCSMWIDVPGAPQYGKIGMVQTPRSDKGVLGWHRQGNKGMFIPRDGKNKEAAFLFIQWLSSYPVAYRAMKDMNHSTPFRRSIVEDPDFRNKFVSSKKLAHMGNVSSDRTPPLIPEWAEFEDIVAAPFQKCMIGTMSPEVAADAAAKGVERMLKRKGYYRKGKPFRDEDGNYPNWLTGNFESLNK